MKKEKIHKAASDYIDNKSDNDSFYDAYSKGIKFAEKEFIIAKKELDSLKKLNRITFKLMDKKDMILTIPIVDLKHHITEKPMAAIGQDSITSMPVIQILTGKYKDKRFMLDIRNLVEMIERLINE